MKSAHQKRVEKFMQLQGTKFPAAIGPDMRVFLARLVMEETLEYIQKGLGVEVHLCEPANDHSYNVNFDYLYFDWATNVIDKKETVDGVCDIRFVTTQALSLLGYPDELFQQEVDTNNLIKFASGSYEDEHGKLIKPEDHPEPNIQKLIDILEKENVDV